MSADGAVTDEAVTGEAAEEPRRVTDPEPLHITDPRMLRALAHPARIAILEHLILDGPATATQCAEVAGLSPSACSYHLRALARFGFIEPDPGSAADGRQRPWRPRVSLISYGDPQAPPAALAAERTLTRLVQQSMDEIRDRYHARETQYPAEWRAAAGLGRDVLHVTPAELIEVKERVLAELSRLRRLDPEDRPPGALRVQVVLDMVPWFEPEEAR
jgi:DNA-binding transcriptional ArsR family regulator